MKSLNFKILARLGLALMSTTCLTANAGGQDGGGGGAYVCRNADGSIREAKLVDLWESAHTKIEWSHKVGSLKIPLTNEKSVDEQFNRAMEKLARVDSILADVVKKEAKKIEEGKEFVDDEIAIALPDDLKVGYFPKGCAAEGMMYYDGESKNLNIREDIFKAMKTNTEIAAARAHEAIYKVLREKFKQSTSKNTRRLVACLFSEEEGCLKPAFTAAPMGQRAYTCSNEEMEVDIIANSTISSEKELFKYGSLFHIRVSKMKDNVLGYNPFFTVESGGLFMQEHKPTRPIYSMGIENLNTKNPLAIFGVSSVKIEEKAHYIVGNLQQLEDGRIASVILNYGTISTETSTGRNSMTCKVNLNPWSKRGASSEPSEGNAESTPAN